MANPGSQYGHRVRTTGVLRGEEDGAGLGAKPSAAPPSPDPAAPETEVSRAEDCDRAVRLLHAIPLTALDVISKLTDVP